MDRFSKEERSRLMGKIRGKDTKDEVRLAKALWKRNVRYRKHNKSIPGTPDLSLKKYKIAIFVDSEFFHGKDWETRKKPVTNAEFWDAKVRRNMERDRRVNETLEREGWAVIRYWSDDVRKNVEEIADDVVRILAIRKATRVTLYS